jgi:hypothetical protein
MFYVISYVNYDNVAYNIYLYKVVPFIVSPDQYKSVLVQVNQIMDGGRYVETLREETYNGNASDRFSNFLKYAVLRNFHKFIESNLLKF